MNNEITSVTTSDAQAFTAGQVATNLDISTSSLRKYSAALEESGYNIVRDVNDRRIYYERDIDALRLMREMIASGIVTDTAAEYVANNKDEIGDNDNSSGNVPSVRDEGAHLLAESISELSEDLRKDVDNMSYMLMDHIARQVDSIKDARSVEISELIDENKRLMAEVRRLNERRKRGNWLSRLLNLD